MLTTSLPTNHEQITQFLSNYKGIVIIVTVITALIITLIVMPKVVAISKAKNLTALPNGRTSHKGVIPTLGGVGVFTGVVLTIQVAAILFANYSQLIDLMVFNVLILLLLLVGLADDIMKISPKRKLAYQLLVASIFVIATNLNINSFVGLFGIYKISLLSAILFSIFVIVLVINAYNLIDGIDGLAGVLGAIISIITALLFYYSGHFFYCLISLALVGALIGFLVFNFSRNRKIFLGDTGSMVVGFVLAIQMITYLSLAGNNPDKEIFQNAPVIVLALLSYPLLDTLRVFCVRICNKKSPFSADRNHIHHRLIDLGLKHKWATSLIALYTIGITVLVLALNHLDTNVVFAITVPVAIFILVIPFAIQYNSGKIKFVLPTL